MSIAAVAAPSVAPPKTRTAFRVSLPTGQLQQQLADVGRVIGNRPPVPVLSGFVLHADERGLFLQGFDYEVSIEVRLDAKRRAPFRACLPARLMADLLKHHRKDGTTELRVDTDRWYLAEPVRNREADGLLLPVADYPALPDVAAAPPLFTLDGAAFHQLVKRAQVSAGKDQTLPILTGARFELEKRRLTVITTDRYRLGVDEYAVTPPARVRRIHDPGCPLVPVGSLATFAKIVDKGDTVEIGWHGELLVLRTDRATLTTRLLEGDFPRYRALLPAEFTATVTTDRARLVEEIRYVSTTAERNTPIRLDVSPTGVTLQAGTGDEAKAKTTDVPVTSFEGEATHIAFNPHYLLDGLAAQPSDEIVLSLVSPQKPAIIGARNSDYRYLLMPVRLSG